MAIKYFPKYPVRSAWRAVHYNLNPLMFPTINVNEFPKSGGTWMSRMISECTQYRFDDNAYPWFGASVVKHHTKGFDKKRVVKVIRDPRDVYVSLYFHCKKAFAGDGWNKKAVKLVEKHYFDKERSEEEEINYFVQAVQSNPIMPSFTWQEFYLAQQGKGDVLVKYEELRSDTFNVLVDAFEKLELSVDEQLIQDVVDKNNIDKILKNRKNKEEAHFVRRGKVGGYETYLTDETVSIVEQNNSEAMKLYGYS